MATSIAYELNRLRRRDCFARLADAVGALRLRVGQSWLVSPSMLNVLTRLALPLLLLSACVAPSTAARSPETPSEARGAVSSADPRASEAGREILRAGGSAADAAIAMLLALPVVERQSTIGRESCGERVWQ